MLTKFPSYITDKYTFVQSINDFPNPDAGVIRLEDDTSYQINGDIDLDGNRIVFGTNNLIYGVNRLTDKLRASTLTGNMFTGVSKTVLFDTLQLSCPNGSLFNFDGGVVQLFKVSFAPTKNFGTMNAMATVAFRNIGSTVQVFTTQGLIFTGTNTNFDLVDSLFTNNVGTLIDFDASVWTSIIIDRNRFKANAGQTIISGAAASANIASGGNGNIGGNNFFGIGTYINTITQTDILWKFFDNGGIKNSQPRGSFNMIGNATVTNVLVVSTPLIIAGTTTTGLLEHFTHTNGRLTYNGVDTITFIVRYVVSFIAASNSTKIWRFFVAKNGTALSTSTQKASSTTNTLLIELTVIDNITLATDDYLEPFVQNDTDTTDLTVDTLNFQIN